MQTEIEVKFWPVDREKMREKLRSLGAELIKDDFVQRRHVFDVPAGCVLERGWVRVRDEGDMITMSLKAICGEKITDQKETCLVIDNYDVGVEFLRNLGCEEKAYQETRRELWKYMGCEITIDEWPYLEVFVEVEGESEEAVKKCSEALGFDYETGKYGAVDVLYTEKYGISKERINNQTPRICFGEENPFL